MLSANAPSLFPGYIYGSDLPSNRSTVPEVGFIVEASGEQRDWHAMSRLSFLYEWVYTGFLNRPRQALFRTADFIQERRSMADSGHP